MCSRHNRSPAPERAVRLTPHLCAARRAEGSARSRPWLSRRAAPWTPLRRADPPSPHR